MGIEKYFTVYLKKGGVLSRTTFRARSAKEAGAKALKFHRGGKIVETVQIKRLDKWTKVARI